MTTQVRHSYPIVLSGLLAGFAYPLWVGVPTGFLMWFALVPLFLALKNTVDFKTYFFKTYGFILVNGLIFSHFVAASGITNWLFSYLLQPILMFMPFAVYYFFQRGMGWRKALWALPFIWAACDWLQHLVPHSFQISSIAYTQTTVIWFAQIADIFGMWGITFWLVLLNATIAFTIDTIKNTDIKKPKHTPLSNFSIFVKKWAWQAAVLFGLPLLYAFFAYLNLPTDKQIKVALVQTNENSYAAMDSIAHLKSIQNVIRLANEAAKTEPDLIVVPESAFNLPLLQDTAAFSLLQYYISNWHTSLAVGFPHYPDSSDFSKKYNSAIVFTPQLAEEWHQLHLTADKIKVYHKQNPLPFMEYMPYADWLGFRNVLGLNGSEILRGDKTNVFNFPDKNLNTVKTSATICWEQLFPKTQAELTEKGATFLSQMNNDGWFGNTIGQGFLLNTNRMRAIENRRTIARSSNTGFSTFIDPFGRLYGTIEPFTEAFGTGNVYLNSELSFFTKYKNWFPKACFFICILYIFFSFIMQTKMLKSNNKKSMILFKKY
jgi:apolipoprotein N-acyltransferase